MQNKGLVVAVGVVAVGVAAYFGATVVAEHRAETLVDESLERFEQQLEAGGVEAALAYKDLTIKKFTLQPQASLSDFTITLTNTKKHHTTVVTVPEIRYYLRSFDMQNYDIEAQGDIHFQMERYGAKQEPRILQFAEMPVLNVEVGADGVRQYNLNVSNRISLVEEDKEDGATEKSVTEVTFEEMPLLQWKETVDGRTLNQNVSLKGVHLTQDGEAIADLQGVTLLAGHDYAENDSHTATSALAVQGLTFHEEELQPFNPINVANELVYKGPFFRNLSEVDGSAPMQYNLKNFALTSGKGNISASGIVDYTPGEDKLPYGGVNIRITEVEKLFGHIEQLDPRSRYHVAILREALERMSGNPVQEGATLAVDVTREKAGHLRIGHLSLEETLAYFFRMMMPVPPAAEQDPGTEGEGDNAAAPETGEQAPTQPETTAPEVNAPAAEEKAPVPAQ